MQEILKVDGMVCEGCERRLNDVLEKLNYVEKVKIERSSKTVTVFLKEPTRKDILKKEIENIGFKVIN